MAEENQGYREQVNITSSPGRITTEEIEVTEVVGAIYSSSDDIVSKPIKDDFPEESEATQNKRQAILEIQRDQSLSAVEKSKRIQNLMSGKRSENVASKPMKDDFPEEGESTQNKRQAILAIQRDKSLSAAEKSRKIQSLMNGNAGSQQTAPPNASSAGSLSRRSDIAASKPMKDDFPEEGEATLNKRQAILAIQRDKSLSAAEKSRKIQSLMSGSAGFQQTVPPNAKSVGEISSSLVCDNDKLSLGKTTEMKAGPIAAREKCNSRFTSNMQHSFSVSTENIFDTVSPANLKAPPSMRKDDANTSLIGRKDPQELAAVAPGVVSVRKSGDSRVARKIQASMAASQDSLNSSVDFSEPAAGKPGFVAVRRNSNESKVARKIRASMSSSQQSLNFQNSSVNFSEPAAATPGFVAVRRNSNESKVARKIQSSLSSSQGSLNNSMNFSEPAAVAPGFVAVRRNSNESKVARKIQASLSASQGSLNNSMNFSEPAAVAPGFVAVRQNSNESKVARKIHASLSASQENLNNSVNFSEPVATAPGVVSMNDRDDSRVARKARRTTTSVSTGGNMLAESAQSPDISQKINPGTVTMMKGTDSRVARKVRTSSISVVNTKLAPSATAMKASEDNRVQRKMRSSGKPTNPKGTITSSMKPSLSTSIVEDLETFQDEGPDQENLAGRAIPTRNSRDSILSRKIAQGRSRPAKSPPDMEKPKSQHGDLEEGDVGQRLMDTNFESRVGAVQSTGNDPAQRKSSWVNDNLFSNEEGKEIDVDDYLRQQVAATREAKAEKLKKQNYPKADPNKMQKDGVAAVPKSPGAFSINGGGGGGWFTGGFRMRTRNQRQSRRVIDEDVTPLKEDDIEENETPSWDKSSILVGTFLVFLIIVGVTIPLIITEKAPNTPVNELTENTLARRDALFGKFVELLSNVTEPEFFDEENSPQRTALNWLLYNDTLELMPNDPKVIPRYLLMLLYHNNAGNKWTFESTNTESAWGSGSDVCKWEGVCSENASIVDALTLKNFGLRGPLPSELIHFANLTSLDLSENNKLRKWDFLTVLLQMTKLERLALVSMDLEGTIPPEISNLSHLQKLLINSNNFRGSLPTEMKKMSSLQVFKAADNRLEGDLFKVTSTWKQLMKLDVPGNAFTGTIPTEIGLQQNITLMRLSRNEKIGGSLPTEIGLLTSLMRLELSLNQISGSIPAELGQCASLKSLYLDSNNFINSIPSDFGSFLNINRLRLDQNMLTGTVPTSLGRCAKLSQFSFENNKLSGQIPIEIKNLKDLQELKFRNNGNITFPSHLCEKNWTRLCYRCNAGEECCTNDIWECEDGYKKEKNGR